MTKRVYHMDAAQSCCEAKVLACIKGEQDETYEILLDQTVIFPESGGQCSDHGRIGGVEVRHSREEGDEVWHIADGPLQVGETVEVCTDMNTRMEYTRQHTGEHIFSGLAFSLYGARNVGFHMADTYMTVDLDQYLNAEQLEELERACNRAVQANLPITSNTVGEDALEGLTLRKQAEGLKGDIRIVYIGDVDSCTCCGTHCASTGEVGYIRVSSAMRYKGGVRIWIDCGMRAVNAAMSEHRLVDELSQRFSTNQQSLSAAIAKQGADLAEAKRKHKQNTQALISLLSEKLLGQAKEVSGIKLVVHTEEGFSANELKMLADALARERAVAVLFSTNEGALLYQLSCFKGCKLSMREVCQSVNALCGGKGGGRDENAQGAAQKIPLGFEACLERLELYLESAIKSK